jgi:hypothetical protein
MSWWFHPDRKDDLRDRMSLTQVTDFDVTESTDDEGMQIRVARWRDRRGWHHQHWTERQLGSDRLGRPSGGKFIVPGIAEVSFEPPRGEKMTLVCDSRIEFIPKDDGSTEVVVVHNHTWPVEGGYRDGIFEGPTGRTSQYWFRSRSSYVKLRCATCHVPHRGMSLITGCGRIIVRAALDRSAAFTSVAAGSPDNHTSFD